MAIQQIEGNYQPGDATFGIVVARFNHFITDRLLDGALDCLNQYLGACDAR